MMLALDGSGVDIYDILAAPFRSDQVSWRVGSTNARFQADKKATKGKPLAYIDARDLYARLDEACKACGTTWQCKYKEIGPLVAASIGIKIDGEWLWRSNGAGQTDIEGEKGMFSDAIKRAGVPWGVGAYLYDIKTEMMELDDRGGFSDKIKAALNDLHERAGNKVKWGDRPALKVYQFTEKVLRHFSVTPETVAELWDEVKDSGEFHGMPAEMKRTFKAEYIDRPQATA